MTLTGKGLIDLAARLHGKTSSFRQWITLTTKDKAKQDTVATIGAAVHALPCVLAQHSGACISWRQPADALIPNQAQAAG